MADVTARLRYLRAAVAGAYVCGMLVTPRLWFGVGRTFPRAPLTGILPASLSAAEYLLSPLLLVALILAAVAARPRRYLAASTVLTVLLVVSDQTRLQPWVYQYLVMLALLACARTTEADETDGAIILAACRLVVAALYFWSGAQKLNWTFAHEVVPELLGRAGLQLPAVCAAYLPVAAVVAAICESLIGVGLLLRRTRRAALVSALVMHLLLLSLLVASSSNSVVWVWNVCMPVLVVLLFWRAADPLVPRGVRQASGSRLAGHACIAALALCCLAPALSFFGWWDAYLSAALYSGNTPVGVLRVDERVRQRLPEPAQRVVFTTKRGELMLPFYEWSMAELNAPPYPEERVYRHLARQLCGPPEDGRELELIVKERPSALDGSYTVTRADCRELSEGR